MVSLSRGQEKIIITFENVTLLFSSEPTRCLKNNYASACKIGPLKNEQATRQPDPPLYYSCPNYKQKTYTCSRILNTWKSNNKLAFLKKQNKVVLGLRLE